MDNILSTVSSVVDSLLKAEPLLGSLLLLSIICIFLIARYLGRIIDARHNDVKSSFDVLKQVNNQTLSVVATHSKKYKDLENTIKHSEADIRKLIEEINEDITTLNKLLKDLSDNIDDIKVVINTTNPSIIKQIDKLEKTYSKIIMNLSKGNND